MNVIIYMNLSPQNIKMTVSFFLFPPCAVRSKENIRWAWLQYSPMFSLEIHIFKSKHLSWVSLDEMATNSVLMHSRPNQFFQEFFSLLFYVNIYLEQNLKSYCTSFFYFSKLLLSFFGQQKINCHWIRPKIK
jgi:hypothetical protein